jgi:hypothetical protein
MILFQRAQRLHSRSTDARPGAQASGERGEEQGSKESWEEKLASDLVKSEYDSLRQESVQARTAQQQILQWSLAAFSAIFAAGLVLAGQANINVREGFGGLVFIVVFGFALPGLITGSCWSWLGELARMERVGYYLRGLEQHLSGLRTGSSLLPCGPLHWETYLSTGISRKTGFGKRKQLLGYVGSLGLYFGSLCVSIAIFIAALREHVFGPNTWKGTTDTLYGVGAFWLALFVTVAAFAGFSLRRTSRQAQDFGEILHSFSRSLVARADPRNQD